MNDVRNELESASCRVALQFRYCRFDALHDVRLQFLFAFVLDLTSTSPQWLFSTDRLRWTNLDHYCGRDPRERNSLEMAVPLPELHILDVSSSVVLIG